MVVVMRIEILNRVDVECFYSLTHKALPAQIVSALVSISALELVKRSVAIRSLAPICLLLGVEKVALTFLFLPGAEPMSHSGFFLL